MATQEPHLHHILYLEDDWQTLLADIHRMQARLPVQFHIAKSYEEALQVMQDTHIDLFMLDIELTEDRRTGIHLAEQLRQLPPYRHTPILFVSMHRHFSHSLLAKIRHCAFLAKPFTEEECIEQIGVALEIPEYLQRHYAAASLLLPQGRTYIEVAPQDISYIEVAHRRLFVQLITGETIRMKDPSGTLKNILAQIETQGMDCLRQIYRSIIINVNQIKTVQMQKNIGWVVLFNDKEPKPVGIQYRHNLQEFL